MKNTDIQLFNHETTSTCTRFSWLKLVFSLWKSTASPVTVLVRQPAHCEQISSHPTLKKTSEIQVPQLDSRDKDDNDTEDINQLNEKEIDKDVDNGDDDLPCGEEVWLKHQFIIQRHGQHIQDVLITHFYLPFLLNTLRVKGFQLLLPFMWNYIFYLIFLVELKGRKVA